MKCPGVLLPMVLACSLWLPSRALAQAPPSFKTLGNEIVSDFKWTINSFEADAESIVLSPLHIKEAIPLLEEPSFYLILGGAAALWGGAFALDQTVRANLQGMSNGDANLLQDVSYGSIGVSTGLLYAWGLYSRNDRLRQYMITAGESAGLSELWTIGFKSVFGRLRPRQAGSHTAFFEGGRSFPSGDATPMFAMATAISEYFDREWYVAAPAYSLALLDGFGRIGHSAHWMSDIAGSALLGIATTELLLYLHKLHAANPKSFRIFPASAPAAPAPGASTISVSAGLGLGFSW